MTFPTNSDLKGIPQGSTPVTQPYGQTQSTGNAAKPSTETATRIEKTAYEPIDTLERLGKYPDFKLSSEQVGDSKAQFPQLPAPLENVEEKIVDYKPYTASEQANIAAFYDQSVEKELKILQQAVSDPADLEKINLLRNAFKTGKVPSEVADSFVAISKLATEATRENFAIPNWTKESSSIADFTPVGLNALQATQLGNQQAIHLMKGMISHLKGIEAGILKGAKDFPEGIPQSKATSQTSSAAPESSSESIGYGDFLTMITQAIGAMQEQLNKMQMQDASTSMNTSQTKKDDIEATQAQSKTQQQEMEKQRHMSGIMKIVSNVLKFVGPALMVLGIVGTALTGGALAPLLIATAAMMTFSVLNSQFDITSKAVQAVDKAIDAILPEGTPDWVKGVVKVAITAVAVVAIIAVGAVLTGGASLLSEAAATVAKTTIKILVTQAVIMAVMCSNAIPEMAADIVKSCGGGETASQITEIIAMLMQAVVMMVGAAMCGGGGAKGAAEGAQQAAKTTAQLTEQTASTLQKALDALASAAKTAKEALTPSFVRLDDIIKGFKQLGEGTKLQVTGKISTLIAEIAGPVSNAAAGGVRAVCLTISANSLEVAGEANAAIQMLKDLIQYLEQLLESLQSSMSSRGQEQASLQNLFTSVLSAYQKSTDFGPVFG